MHLKANKMVFIGFNGTFFSPKHKDNDNDSDRVVIEFLFYFYFFYFIFISNCFLSRFPNLIPPRFPQILNLSRNSSIPDFSVCSQNTVLVWAPCSVVWFSCLVWVVCLCRMRTFEIRRSFFNIFKLVTICLSLS